MGPPGGFGASSGQPGGMGTGTGMGPPGGMETEPTGVMDTLT